MANTSDTLELKVTDSEYASRIGQLDQKISKLTTILQDYQTLKNDATQVFGEDVYHRTARVMLSYVRKVRDELGWTAGAVWPEQSEQ